jgi:hypothetical protein
VPVQDGEITLATGDAKTGSAGLLLGPETAAVVLMQDR